MVKARLTAPQRELEIMAVLFTGDPGVRKDESGYFLQASDIDSADQDGREPVLVAETILSRLIGTAKTLVSTFAEVTISGWEGYQPKARLAITGIWGMTWDPINHGLDVEWAQSALALADSDSSLRVARVLRLMSSLARDASWFDMYKIFELVREDVGRKAVIELFGGDRALSDFTESATRYEISGDRARHAVYPGSPSGRSMAVGDARIKIRDVVRKWLAGRATAY